VDAILARHVAPSEDLVIRDPRGTTIVKERFVEPQRNGAELSKLFSVNFLDPDPPAPAVLAEFAQRFRRAAAEVDAVLLLDFGHGLFGPDLRDLIQDTAPFLVLNCQTNSNNHGFNIITRQYRKADAFTLDQQELLLAAGRRHLDFEQELATLRDPPRRPLRLAHPRTPSKPSASPPASPPASAPRSKPTSSTPSAPATPSSPSPASPPPAALPVDLGTFLGQLAGAQAVRIVGNAQPISKSILLKSGMSLLDG
jgi:hypothetical protein